eukprot:ctg_7780.g555
MLRAPARFEHFLAEWTRSAAALVPRERRRRKSSRWRSLGRARVLSQSEWERSG